MLQNKEAWLQESKLAKMLCMGHREFGTNRWRFLSKTNTLYFRLCKHCEFMMCILIVNHQFKRMHPWCSWECMLPGRCSPGNVEKSVFSIWVDLFLCRSIQLLVLSYAKMFVNMYLSQLMSTFTNYLKVHHLLNGFFIP